MSHADGLMFTIIGLMFLLGVYDNKPLYIVGSTIFVVVISVVVSYIVRKCTVEILCRKS